MREETKTPDIQDAEFLPPRSRQQPLLFATPPTTGWDALVTLAGSEVIQAAIAKVITPESVMEKWSLIAQLIPMGISYLERMQQPAAPPPPPPEAPSGAAFWVQLTATLSPAQRELISATLTPEQVELFRAAFS